MNVKGTGKLFYEDAYVKEFKAEVLSAFKDEKKDGLWGIVLDKTALFPEGGGQYGDRGMLEGFQVTDTVEKNGEVIHYVKASGDLLPFKAGDIVTGLIDFDLRLDRMTQHTAEHIVSGLVYKQFGYNNVGFHLGDDVTTLDFDGELTAEELQDIEDRANGIVRERIAVNAAFPTPEELEKLDYRSKKKLEGDVRIVTIPQVDTCACCAPHLSSTGEIGIIRLVDIMRHRGGVRVTLLAGDRAVRDFREKERILKELGALLSKPQDGIMDAVESVLQENREIKERLVGMQLDMLKAELDRYVGKPGEWSAVIFSGELDRLAVKFFTEYAAGLKPNMMILMAGSDEEGYQYHAVSSTLDLRGWSSELNAALQGRGGGKNGEVHGNIKASRAEIEACDLVQPHIPA